MREEEEEEEEKNYSKTPDFPMTNEKKLKYSSSPQTSCKKIQ